MTGEQGGERHPCSVLALQPKVIYPSSHYDDGDDDDDGNDDDDDDDDDEVWLFNPICHYREHYN